MFKTLQNVEKFKKNSLSSSKITTFTALYFSLGFQ